MSSGLVNPDLAKERHANLDLAKLTKFLGETQFKQPGEYENMLDRRNDLIARIKPVYEENFYNLNRDQKYQMILNKSLQMCEYANEKNLDLGSLVKLPLSGPLFGAEKFIYGLHISAFTFSLELWGSDEQSKHWKSFMKRNGAFGTYVQTEIGHGTFVRGLETTATYDKTSKEFVIHSPTVSSIKFWPGAAGKTCNFAIVMAKLIIDEKEYGIHAFIVQLRSLENHTTLPGLELGDIGLKYGFDTQDNGYLKFTNMRIPLNNMLMRYAVVSENGQFKRIGNEMIMYACMLILRALLSVISTSYCSMTTTIAIRYSCVRRQTAGPDGIESQIIDYKTQQYKLFPALATTYAYYFTSNHFVHTLNDTKNLTNNFEKVKPLELNQIHAVTSALKAMSFINALKFSQSNRHCCVGHGYSMASGIPQLVQELDAGCSYEGDNTVLLLQTARYLLKCAQKGTSPHFELPNRDQLKSSGLYKSFEEYFDIYNRLYEESIAAISNKMLFLINEKGFTQHEAWNESSILLINASKVYINIYVANCFLTYILAHEVPANQAALIQLFELFILYDFCENFSSDILKYNIVESNKMSEYSEKINQLLSQIRVNAVLLVDAFGWLDTSLCSALGAYDGKAYERLYEFAKNSEFNKQDVHEGYAKFIKPFMLKMRQSSKL